MAESRASLLLISLDRGARRELGARYLRELHAEFVVSKPSSTFEAIQTARARQPEVAVVRVGGWSQSEATFIGELHDAAPQTSLLLVSPSTPDLFALAEQGVRGWLRATEPPDRWLTATLALASGGSWLLPPFAGWMLLNLEAEGVGLPREREVLRRVHAGQQYSEIAAALGISAAEAKNSVHIALDTLLDVLEGLSNEEQDEGFEASGDRAPRPRPHGPGTLSAARPLPREPQPPTDALHGSIDATDFFA